MMYYVEGRVIGRVFSTYEAAEFHCRQNGIHPEEIIEITEDEAAEICD
jgi:hypothetical protein